MIFIIIALFGQILRLDAKYMDSEIMFMPQYNNHTSSKSFDIIESCEDKNTHNYISKFTDLLLFPFTGKDTEYLYNKSCQELYYDAKYLAYKHNKNLGTNYNYNGFALFYDGNYSRSFPLYLKNNELYYYFGEKFSPQNKLSDEDYKSLSIKINDISLYYSRDFEVAKDYCKQNGDKEVKINKHNNKIVYTITKNNKSTFSYTCQ